MDTHAIDPRHTQRKRALLFLLGCIPVRLLVCYMSATRVELLPALGALALLPALGFAILYAFDLRKTGPEVFGGAIWWNSLRPLHALLWGTFAVLALRHSPHAWKVLLADTLLGLAAWTAHRM